MSERKIFFKYILFGGDLFLMYLSLFLALIFRYWDFSFPFGPEKLFFPFLLNFSILFLFWSFFLFVFDFYKIPFFRKEYSFSQNLFLFIIFSFLTATAFFYLQPHPRVVPKTILVLVILLFSFFLSLWRYLLNLIFFFKKTKEKIIFIGFQKEIKELLFSPHFQEEYKPIAIFTNIGPSLDLLVISDPLKLKELIEKEKINTIVLAPFGFNEEVVKWLLKDEKPNLNIISFSDLYEEITKKVPLSSVNKLWVLENFKEKKLEMILKRILDVILSLIGLLITLIIFPLVALLIKIDLKDSIFYKQKRKGKDGKIFTIYKFRTVKENNEKEKDIFKAVKKDLSLLSPISRFLRRWEIDEFPQFFNILKGELSFVGPRPEWIELSNVYEKEIPNFSYRYLIKPGLTGWAQIHYPPSTSLSEGEEKLAYDLYYIKNYSFFLDIYILFKTFYLLLFKSFENLN